MMSGVKAVDIRKAVSKFWKPSWRANLQLGRLHGYACCGSSKNDNRLVQGQVKLLVRKTRPFVQDGASHHREGHFSGSIEDVNQNSDEDDASAGKPTRGSQWKVGTSGTHNQRETEARVEPETVLNPGLELAGRGGFDLTLETESDGFFFETPFLSSRTAARKAFWSHFFWAGLTLCFSNDVVRSP